PPPPPSIPAHTAAPRLDPNSLTAHAQLVEKTKKGKIDVYFLGDSITRRWGATDYPDFLANWKQNFHGWNAANFGWGGDQTQHILWRLQNGELDNVNPKVIVLQAGTNNIGAGAAAPDVLKGIEAILATLRSKVPNAVIVLTALFPRTDRPSAPAVIQEVNAALAGLPGVRFLNINDKLTPAMFLDKLHPNLAAYQVWADALKPILTEILGPPAAEDQAPPPTGDPSARRP
ncbi:MAG: GDSL-type esterase/lipase family protein, partial [Bryobacteraceae bacterium]|nr:GDSL-type esterase/lipase family protein [Bryobacteraceae bacterium]